MPSSLPDTAPALTIEGRALETSNDVAEFFEMHPGHLIYSLYKAPPDERYRHFEIPKRTGGMRLISSPRGVVRDCQQKLAPLLQAIYDAHPSAHGFIKERSVVTNASGHVGRHWVLNVDLYDFFPTINFGRVRGLFMAPPFRMGAKAATVMAQLCTYRNGLPQGAPTSPALSNFVAGQLDRRLTRLAKEQKCRYSRYADDITFSCDHTVFPPALATLDVSARLEQQVKAGDALEEAIRVCGFAINAKKVRLQGVTGIKASRASPSIARSMSSARASARSAPCCMPGRSTGSRRRARSISPNTARPQAAASRIIRPPCSAASSTASSPS